MAKLSIIEGIGGLYEEKLNEAGVTSIEKLLEECSSKRGRTELAEKSGIAEKLILKWANHADLFRIKGVGSEYAELLEAAGVDTVPELAKRKTNNLVAKMAEVNQAMKLVRRVPTTRQAGDWIDQAGYDDVLEVMLRYRLQMTEQKPCRRFINTLSHAMANGESLTSMRKQYLKAFCTVPAVVKRQQHDADMATRRAKTQPDASTKKWQSIQTAIYEVIR